MSSHFLSAKEAKELSLNGNDKLDERFLLPILEKIKVAAMEGLTYITIIGFGNTYEQRQYIIRRLKELGYYVKDCNHRNDTSYKISWDHIGDE